MVQGTFSIKNNKTRPNTGCQPGSGGLAERQLCTRLGGSVRKVQKVRGTVGLCPRDRPARPGCVDSGCKAQGGAGWMNRGEGFGAEVKLLGDLRPVGCSKSRGASSPREAGVFRTRILFNQLLCALQGKAPLLLPAPHHL